MAPSCTALCGHTEKQHARFGEAHNKRRKLLKIARQTGNYQEIRRHWGVSLKQKDLPLWQRIYYNAHIAERARDENLARHFTDAEQAFTTLCSQWDASEDDPLRRREFLEIIIRMQRWRDEAASRSAPAGKPPFSPKPDDEQIFAEKDPVPPVPPHIFCRAVCGDNVSHDQRFDGLWTRVEASLKAETMNPRETINALRLTKLMLEDDYLPPCRQILCKIFLAEFAKGKALEAYFLQLENTLHEIQAAQNVTKTTPNGRPKRRDNQVAQQVTKDIAILTKAVRRIKGVLEAVESSNLKAFESTIAPASSPAVKKLVVRLKISVRLDTNETYRIRRTKDKDRRGLKSNAQRPSQHRVKKLPVQVPILVPNSPLSSIVVNRKRAAPMETETTNPHTPAKKQALIDPVAELESQMAREYMKINKEAKAKFDRVQRLAKELEDAKEDAMSSFITE